LSQQHGAHPVAHAIRPDINRVFYGESISIPWPELRCVTESHHIALEFCHQIRQSAIQNHLSPPGHLSFIRSDRLEGRRARRDEVAIDRGEMRYVGRSGRANQASRHAVRRVGLGNRRSQPARTGNRLPEIWIECSHVDSAEPAPHASLNYTPKTIKEVIRLLHCVCGAAFR
jgi:hypothetical protein